MRSAAVVVALLLVGCSANPPGPTPTGTRADGTASVVTAPAATPSATLSATPGQPTSTPDAVAACRMMAGRLSMRAQAGQLVMTGVAGSLDAAERKAITANKVGSVILMGGTGGLAKVAGLTASLRTLGGANGMLVATDQEGGLVQRLRGSGFPTMPSAAKQAKLSDAALAKAAKGWGSALAKAGVRLNLAPVADVVPAANRNTNQPVARLGRGYGSKPATVSAKVAAFRAGMRAAGVESAVKHFPGLGAVKGNTDFRANVIDRTTSAASDLLTPFRDAAADRTGAVMVSSAIYQKIDAKNLAMFSPKIIGILRGWGYDGVVISDDLGVAAAVRSVPVKQRAYRLVAAGGDIALTTAPAAASALVAGLIEHAKADPSFARKVTESATRVLQLKETLGLITCS